MSSAHVASEHPVAGRLLAAACLAASALVLTACASMPAPELASPARVVQVAGSSIPRLELTHGAVRRLAIQTRPVAAAAPGTAGATEVIPYAAVVYDTDGSSWTYVEIATGTYMRQPITVTVIRSDMALLSAGPALGARVVTVGSAELLGTEYNISGEE